MRKFKVDMGNTKVHLYLYPSSVALADILASGTWVPLDYGRLVAEKYGALDKLRPLFDFVHHDRDKTPPQAPKHTTAASTKPRLPKAALPRKIPSKLRPCLSKLKYFHSNICRNQSYERVEAG